MKLLFEIDTKDYDPGAAPFIRPSARSIIIEANKVAMVHSVKYNYYKFPGGGIEPGESRTEALIRETLEEAGLIVIPSSVREYGYVHRIQRGVTAAAFIQDNYYYFCKAAPYTAPQHLDDYEAEEKFTLEYVDPVTAIRINREKAHGPKDQNMLEREARVLEFLIRDGLLK